MKEVSKIGLDSLPADEALENAKGEFQDVLMVGWGVDGELTVFSSSGLTRADSINFIISKLQHGLLAGDYTDD